METDSAAQPVPHAEGFRPTTPDQRRLLFNIAEQLENVSEAARRAHVGRGTYYYWQPQYEAAGVAGWMTERSRAPHRTRIPPTSAELQAGVLVYHHAHPGAGCRSIADTINQAHHWEKVIGHTKVHARTRVSAARPVTPPVSATTVAPTAMPGSGAVVHAPQANQTVNIEDTFSIDLCVVPWTHTDPTDWVSVSLNEAAAGQSSETPSPAPVGEWPGQAFANPTLSYAEQMQTYVEQR